MRNQLKTQGISCAGGVLCYCCSVLVSCPGRCSSEHGSPLTLGLLGTTLIIIPFPPQGIAVGVWLSLVFMSVLVRQEEALKLRHLCNNCWRLSGQGREEDSNLPFPLLSQQSRVTGQCQDICEPHQGDSGRAASPGRGSGGPALAVLSILNLLLPNRLSLLQGPWSGTCNIVLCLNARDSRLGGYCSVLAPTRPWVLPMQEPKSSNRVALHLLRCVSVGMDLGARPSP